MGYDTEEQQLTLESYSTEAKANIRARVMRMRKLLSHIDKNGQQVHKDKLIALFCIKEGISMATVYSYLNEYTKAELVVQYGDHLLTMDQYIAMRSEDSKRLNELA